MLKFLLDEHISPAVRQIASRQRPIMEIVSMLDGSIPLKRGQTDSAILDFASREGWTLVTYDQRTIRSLLVSLAAVENAPEGTEPFRHSGVVFVDDRTIRQSDSPLLASSIGHLWDHAKDLDWTNRVVYLQRPQA